MNWTFKERGNTWEHFFGQYGMNKINREDFFNLIEDVECIKANECSKNAVSEDDYIDEENEFINEDTFEKTFDINVNANILQGEKYNKENRKYTPRKLNYDEINKKKNSIGLLGEYLVISIEYNYLVNNGRGDLAELIEHVSAKNGDGEGYDIISYDLNGNKKYIEVKTTQSNKADGYYISPKEIKISKEKQDDYKIYRVYNLNIVNETADLEIYTGEVTSKNYNLEAVSYKVTLK